MKNSPTHFRRQSIRRKGPSRKVSKWYLYSDESIELWIEILDNEIKALVMEKKNENRD